LSQLERVEVFLPSLAHATDNGAMVAFTGYARFIQGCSDKEHTIQVKPQWKIAEISEAFGYPIPLD
jgi:tRNA A37 threonylcarbamoyltransferase TsaD